MFKLKMASWSGFSTEEILQAVKNSLSGSGYYDIYYGYEVEGTNDVPWYADDGLDEDSFMFLSKEKALQYVDEVQSMMPDFFDPVPVYRAVRAKSIEEVDLESPGTCWSFERFSALEFGVHNGSNFLLLGEVAHSNIDWDMVLSNFVVFSGNFEADDENEIVVIDDTEIFNLRVEEI